MSDSVFLHKHRVSYADCTVGNHVYYGRYLDFLELARGEFFRHLGMPLLAWQEEDCAFPVVECRLQYKSAARYDDTLEISLWLTMVQGARLNFAYRVASQTGALILEAETSHVCTSVVGKPKRLPDRLCEAVEKYVCVKRDA